MLRLRNNTSMRTLNTGIWRSSCNRRQDRMAMMLLATIDTMIIKACILLPLFRPVRFGRRPHSAISQRGSQAAGGRLTTCKRRVKMQEK